MNALSTTTRATEASPARVERDDRETFVFLRERLKETRLELRRARPTDRKVIEDNIHAMLSAVQERLAA